MINYVLVLDESDSKAEPKQQVLVRREYSTVIEAEEAFEQSGQKTGLLYNKSENLSKLLRKRK